MFNTLDRALCAQTQDFCFGKHERNCVVWNRGRMWADVGVWRFVKCLGNEECVGCVKLKSNTGMYKVYGRVWECRRSVKDRRGAYI